MTRINYKTQSVHFVEHQMEWGDGCRPMSQKHKLENNKLWVTYLLYSEPPPSSLFLNRMDPETCPTRSCQRESFPYSACCCYSMSTNSDSEAKRSWIPPELASFPGVILIIRRIACRALESLLFTCLASAASCFVIHCRKIRVSFQSNKYPNLTLDCVQTVESFPLQVQWMRRKRESLEEENFMTCREFPAFPVESGQEGGTRRLWKGEEVYLLAAM